MSKIYDIRKGPNYLFDKARQSDLHQQAEVNEEVRLALLYLGGEADQGGLSLSYEGVTSSTTLSNSAVYVFTISSAATATLPAVALVAGRRYYVKNASTSAADVTIDADGSETIDNVTTQILTPGDAATVFCDGTEWHIL